MRYGFISTFGDAEAEVRHLVRVRDAAHRLILVEKGSHPLVEGVSYLEMLQNNGVSLTMSEGHVLAQEDGKVMAGLVDYGDAGGQVLALADVGMLGNAASTASRNLTFWQNLARYARSR